jgi:uroporphyrin-III C-methyltransferase
VTGFVHLVGAGPGDPELLTLKAVKAIGCAEVLLVDDLVPEGVLAYARPDARVVHVGKRGGCKSTPQEFITRLMISEAKAGRIVVRLKGGDPMIFGRGGEETEALANAGVRFEVVNGITAGLAAATALGIPLTHRALCHGAILVTGHEREGDATHWAALVDTGLPLVIYMGVARCEAIAQALLDAGVASTLPAAAISNASRPDERRLVTTVGRMAQEIRAAGIASPAILLVGEVVDSRVHHSALRSVHDGVNEPTPIPGSGPVRGVPARPLRDSHRG